jgi:hypothetical protein
MFYDNVASFNISHHVSVNPFLHNNNIFRNQTLYKVSTEFINKDKLHFLHIQLRANTFQQLLTHTLSENKIYL